MIRQLNTKLLIRMVGGLGIVALCVHLLHGFQVKRNVAVQVRQAERAEAEGNGWQALLYLRHCSDIAPDDADILARYGSLLEKQAPSAQAREQAFQLFERALRRDPGRHDVRRRLVVLAMERGQYPEAIRHLEILRESWPQLGAWEELLARCHAANGDYAEAAAWWQRAAERNAEEELACRCRAVTADPLSATAHAGLAAALLAVGRIDDAISEYRQTLALGNRPEPRMVYRAAQLLCQRRRYREAEQMIGKLREPHPLQGDLARPAAEIALHNGDQTRALERARSAAPVASRDYRDHLWLAEFLVKLGRQAEAEETLRRTVQQNPGIPEPWVALVKCRAQADQADQAEAVIEEARRSLPPNRRALALALCYEALGGLDQAEEQYRLALAAGPDDFFVLQAAARFHLRRRHFQKAETYLRRLLDPVVEAPAEITAWARRELALGLTASTGSDEQRFREALNLLDRNAVTHGGSVADQRARAAVLAAYPEHRQEAIRLFEASRKRQPLAPEEQFRLAQLYEAEGNKETAREQLVGLLAGNGQDLAYVSAYVRHLLQQGETQEAQRWLTRLEQLDPDSSQTLEIKKEVRRIRQKPQEVISH